MLFNVCVCFYPDLTGLSGQCVYMSLFCEVGGAETLRERYNEVFNATL